MPPQSTGHQPPNRRDFLHCTAMAVGGLWSWIRLDPLLADGLSPDPIRSSTRRKRTLRLAHMTDFHVHPGQGAEAGMAAALHHAQSQADAPHLILTGGDAIDDSLHADRQRTDLLWKLWNQTLKNECSLPVEHCIGNHDLWGWDRARSKTTGNEPNWGVQRALEGYQLEERYRSFDLAGWHFIVLDSQVPHATNIYMASLDNQQFQWLVADISAVDRHTPILILTHIPILSAAIVEYAKLFKEHPTRRVGASHQDAKKLVDLFRQHPNIRLCLSGHKHLVDEIHYAGVTYICSGAVCGNWWKGNFHHVEEGYQLVDLYDNGTVEHQYVAYGWKPRA